MDDILKGLLLCASMGLVGQGVRAVIGLGGGASALAGSSPNQQTAFNASYLFISLVIGAIAGVLAGLALNIVSATASTPDTPTLLGLISAGYAGTDFIENTFAKLLPNVGNLQKQKQPDTPDTAMKSLTDTIGALSSQIRQMSSTMSIPVDAPAQPKNVVSDVELSAAIKRVLPLVNRNMWLPVLMEAFTKYDMLSPACVAGAMGQFPVEAGEDFKEIREDMVYTHVNHLYCAFKSRFTHAGMDIAAVEALMKKGKEAIGNFVYADYNGNGNEASGDGYKYRGGGLSQLTGKDDYAAFGAAMHLGVDQALEFVSTPEGAALSGCWYLATHGCISMAKKQNWDGITFAVNGKAMFGKIDRRDYSEAFFQALG